VTHRLNQVLTFSNVPGGAIVSLPHEINVYDVPLLPDIIFRDNGDFIVVSCTTTALTVQNTSNQVATLNAWLWRQHTFDREYGGSQTTDLVPQPYIPAANGGGGGGNTIFVQDEGALIPGNPFMALDFVGGNVTASDLGGGVAQIAVSGVPGPPGPAGQGAILVFGVDNIAAAPDTRYIPPGHEFGTAPTTDTLSIPCPRAGTLRNLFVRHHTANGNGNPVVYTLWVNNVPTAITVSLVTGAIITGSDVANSIAVNQGDRIKLVATKAAAIGSGNINIQAAAEVA